MNLKNFKIILCSNVESAKEYNPDATVEAEYGDICVEGSKITLAHHGSRSANPAPCNANITPLSKGLIIVSHLDLDTIGGIMAVTGDKIDAPDFWKAAEFIDVFGPHHMHELPQNIQNQLNAFDAWESTHSGTKHTEPIDVTEIVKEKYEIIGKILNENHPEYDSLIQKGIEWKDKEAEEIEKRCVRDDEKIRAFKSDGIFCAGSYYSAKYNRIVPATITFNEKYRNITVAFEDGGKKLSAKNIVQNLWGMEAGGRDGIAGSPRNQVMTEQDFADVQKVVENLL